MTTRNLLMYTREEGTQIQGACIQQLVALLSPVVCGREDVENWLQSSTFEDSCRAQPLPWRYTHAAATPFVKPAEQLLLRFMRSGSKPGQTPVKPLPARYVCCRSPPSQKPLAPHHMCCNSTPGQPLVKLQSNALTVLVVYPLRALPERLRHISVAKPQGALQLHHVCHGIHVKLALPQHVPEVFAEHLDRREARGALQALRVFSVWGDKEGCRDSEAWPGGMGVDVVRSRRNGLD